MRKLLALVFALVCVISLTGCNNTKQKDVTTYHFSGEHENFTISNGSIILSSKRQEFYGGELTITQPDIFENVTSYSTNFYTINNGERDPFQSNTTTGQTDGAVPSSQKLGNAASNGIMISNLEQGLWFELITIDASGAENVYQIQLTLTK